MSSRYIDLQMARRLHRFYGFTLIKKINLEDARESKDFLTTESIEKHRVCIIINYHVRGG